MTFLQNREGDGPSLSTLVGSVDGNGAGLLEGFETALLDSLSRAPATINDILRPVIASGGKRLRPYLILASGSFGQPSREVLLKTAVAFELLHTASLVHDDIMDQTAFRRGIPSVHSIHGSRAAAFIGAHLLHIANLLIQEFDQKIPADTHQRLKEIVEQAATDLCLGQFQESMNIGNLALTEDEYLQIIDLKTARLFEGACHIGAVLGGSGIDALRSFGHSFGMLYQVADDLRDILGYRPELRRPTCGDLNEGTYTLPIICGLRQPDPSGRRLKSLLGARRGALSPLELSEVLAVLSGSGAIEYAMQRAFAYGDAAIQSIASLPRTSAHDVLEALIGELLADLTRLAEHSHSLGV